MYNIILTYDFFVKFKIKSLKIQENTVKIKT